MDNNNYNIFLTLGINKIIAENYKKTSNSHSKLSSNLSSTTNNKYYDEDDYNELYFQLREKLNQKLYKKTIIEIEHNIKKLKNIEHIRKIQFLKILAIIKIIKTKTKKYFYDNEINNINSFQLKSIKKYFYFINKEIINITKKFFDTFNKNNCKEIINNNIDFIQDIFFIYFYYFNIMLKFYLILNDFKNISLYFIYSFKLFRFSYEFITNSKTLNKISNIFLLYAKFLIINREYEICITFLEKIINICFKELMLKIKNIFNFNNNNNIYKTIKNIIITLFYFGICYENMGKIKKSAECYKQCFWFSKKFFNKLNKDNFFYIFFKFIVQRSIRYNETILYINKCINKKNKIENDNDNNNKKYNDKNINEKYEKKYKNLIHFIKNLNVNEINTINKYKYPKLYYKKTPFNHKEFNLNNLRLLEAYSSKEFKNIIKDMKKINLYDIDNNLYNKIQKNYSKRFYDIFINNINNNKSESNNYKNNKINENSNNNNNTSNINNINYSNNNLNNNNNDNKKIFNIKLLNNSKSLKEKNLIFKKIFLKKNLEKNNNSNINYINYSKNSSRIKTNNNLSYSINNISNTNFNIKKKNNISKKNLSNIENEQMRFSPINIREKSYKKKLKYISKLTDREFDFQKNLLSLKKHSNDNEIKIFNKFEVKKNALNFFNKINILNNTNILNNNNNSISNEDYHKMKVNNNIENTFYKSLSNKSFIEYKKNLKNKKKIKNYFQQEREDDNDINSFNKKTIYLLDKNLKYIENNIRIKKKLLKNKKIFSKE